MRKLLSVPLRCLYGEWQISFANALPIFSLWFPTCVAAATDFPERDQKFHLRHHPSRPRLAPRLGFRAAQCLGQIQEEGLSLLLAARSWKGDLGFYGMEGSQQYQGPAGATSAAAAGWPQRNQQSDLSPLCLEPESHIPQAIINCHAKKNKDHTEQKPMGCPDEHEGWPHSE